MHWGASNKNSTVERATRIAASWSCLDSCACILGRDLGRCCDLILSTLKQSTRQKAFSLCESSYTRKSSRKMVRKHCKQRLVPCANSWPVLFQDVNSGGCVVMMHGLLPTSDGLMPIQPTALYLNDLSNALYLNHLSKALPTALYLHGHLCLRFVAGLRQGCMPSSASR